MTTVVALHGTALAGARFGPAPEAWRWLNLPGHGGAARTRPSVADYAKALIPQLPERFVLIGHSLGGMTAMQLAADLPERCKALVLIDAPLWIPGWLLPGLAQRLAQLMARVPGPALLAEVISRRTRNRGARPAVRQAIRQMDPAGLGDAIRAASSFDGRTLLPRLKAPTLAFFGARSIVTNAQMRGIMAAHPGTQTMTLPEGHMLMFDDPRTFAANLTPFLERYV